MVWTKEQWQQYLKQWRVEHPNYSKDYMKKWNREHPEVHKKWRHEHPENSRKWAKEHPDKIKAHSIARKVQLAEYCETCPDDDIRKATDRHHPDYKFPEIIVSCCRECHFWLNHSCAES